MTQPSYTINKLAELTGIDRRTLKKRLADLTPAKAEGNQKYYTLADALETRSETPTPRAMRSPLPPSGRSGHYLAPYIWSALMATRAVNEMVDEYWKLRDKIHALGAGDDPSFAAAVERDINTVTLGYKRSVFEMLFGKDTTEHANAVSGVWEGMDAIFQGVVDVDMTLNATHSFSSPEAMRYKMDLQCKWDERE